MNLVMFVNIPSPNVKLPAMIKNWGKLGCPGQRSESLEAKMTQVKAVAIGKSPMGWILFKTSGLFMLEIRVTSLNGDVLNFRTAPQRFDEKLIVKRFHEYFQLKIAQF